MAMLEPEAVKSRSDFVAFARSLSKQDPRLGRTRRRRAT